MLTLFNHHVFIRLADALQPRKPDAIFPNNWFYCLHDGRVFLFPMEAPNRRIERREDLIELLSKKFIVS